MEAMPLAAVCQMTSGPVWGDNLAAAVALIEEAARRGATFIALPENFDLMAGQELKRAQADSIEGERLRPLREVSRKLRVTLLCGSFAEASRAGKIHNTSVLLGPMGETLAVYRKLHLFDADVGDEAYRESDLVAPGNGTVVAPCPVGTIGMSICYDLRFPELYRELSSKGADILCVPSAFTERTGRDHWEILLRARAIENLCFVIAPAQWGPHPSGRRTYGRSMIVDPWGTVLCCVPDGGGVGVAEIDLGRLKQVRASLPALKHRTL
jgi:deaminated glutathione amidase